MSNQPPIGVPQGAIRFNTDSQKLEFYAQDRWWEMATEGFELGGNGGASGSPTGNSADKVAGTRMVMAGAETPGNNFHTHIGYINIASFGDEIDFGDLTDAALRFRAPASSRTRGLFAGGTNPSSSPGLQSGIQYVEIATTGNSVSFGSLSGIKRGVHGASSATRGVFMGGRTPSYTDTMDYVQFATTGNAADFGNLTESEEFGSGCQSPIRGFRMGGYTPSGYTKRIDMFTFATLGNAVDFGDMVDGYYGSQNGCSNITRGFYVGGGAPVNPGTYEYFQMASGGNAIVHGDLSRSGGTGERYGSVSSSLTRGIYAGGYNSNGYHNMIQCFELSTGGTGVDFGDRLNNCTDSAGVSNAHGGLG